MKSMKKVLSCALALTIVAGMFAMPAAAEDNEEQAVVAEATETPETPASDADGDFTIEGTKLVKYNGSDTDVVIPDGITVIGNKAFRGNRKIESVTIPDSVIELEDGYDERLSYATYYVGAFFECTALKTVNVGKGLKKIGNYTFNSCSSLETIIFPDGLTSIGSKAFLNCSKLVSLDLSETAVTTIGDFAFESCKTIRSAKLPDTLTELGEGAFLLCSNLAVCKLSNNLKVIKKDTFRQSGLVKITIPDSVNEIEDGKIYFRSGDYFLGAFSECPNLEEVTFSNNLTKIGNYAFKDCNKLSKVSALPICLNTIGDRAFEGCAALPTLNLNETNVTSIGEYAFSGCNAMEKAELPDTLTNLGKYAFQFCTSLNSVRLSNNLEVLNFVTFRGCKSITSIDIPDSVMLIENGGNVASFGWDYAGVFSDCTSIKSVTFGKGLETIGTYCFKNCTALESVQFNNNLKKINKNAFENCKALTEITFGTGLTDVGNEAFLNCSALKAVVMPDSITTFTAANCFNGCTSLTSFDTGNKMQTIECNFENCNMLNELRIGHKLEAINGNSFKGAVNLSEIYYDGTKAEWDDLLLMNGSSYIAQRQAQFCVHCTDGTIYGENYVKKTLESITVKAPKKLEYEIGDQLDVTGGSVTLNYSDKTTNTIPLTLDMCKGFDSSKAGTKTVTVTYEGKTATFNVTIKAGKTVSSITVKAPTKTEYVIGEALDLTGGYVTVTYSDTSVSDPVPLTADMCKGFDSSKAGTKTITVSYAGKTATFKVTVKKGAAPVAQNVTIDGEPVKSITTALKKIKSGDHTIIVTANYTEKSITIPKGLGTVTLICDGGVTLTTDTITANSNLVLDDVTLAGTKAGKYTVVKANADFTANTGTYSNITVKGKADLSDLTVNGNVKLTAKADKDGLVTDTLTNVTVTKGVSSNNNVIFADCPSLGTINVKGTVKITGEATKAVALTASSKTGISDIENLTVEKKVSIAGNLIASGLTANNAVDVKGDAKITDSNIAGKLSAKGLLNVNGDVYCANAVSCGQLTSDETAHLTYQSLAVTKGGIAANSADITVKVIDKKGSTVRFTAGDKKAVVVKSLKLPKGGTYNAVLILDEDCGTGTLTFEKNKVVLK